MSGRDNREPFEALTQRIEPGSTLGRSWELKGGVSAHVTAFEIERPDGRSERLVARRHGPRDLRRNPDIAADEFRLLQLLTSAGVPAPRPRYLDAGGEIFSVPVLVVEYVDGEHESVPADELELVRQLAAVLTEIHRIDRSTADVSFLPDRTLRELPGRRQDESATERRARDLLEAAWPRPQRNPSVLLHGDFWPGNALWNEGRLVAVIDWEDAAVGDPLADVANARLEVLCALGSGAMQEFTCRYEAAMTALDPADLPYWDLWAGLRLAGHISEWGLDDGTEAVMRARSETFVARALEQLSGR